MEKILFGFILSTLIGPAQGGAIKERILKKLDERQSEKVSKLQSVYYVEVDGLARMYMVHVPKNSTDKTKLPLVLALHGGGGNIAIQADDEKYGLITKSDNAGFLLVFANGFSRNKSGMLATWNAGECCGEARDKKIDDVKFISEVLKDVSKRFNVDSKRIYAVGMSNGAMMSYRLACELSDQFSAIAAIAGTDNTLECNPSKGVSILHIHAKNDTHVLFNGGAGKDAFKDKSKVTEFTSVESTIQKWVKLNQCRLEPKKIDLGPGAYCNLYESCRDGSQVKLCVTDDGGHSWPGGKKFRIFGGERPSTKLSANDEFWKFFNR